MYTCPICDYDRMPYPPNNYNICPRCGVEFGNDDENTPAETLRVLWQAASLEDREVPWNWIP